MPGRTPRLFGALAALGLGLVGAACGGIRVPPPETVARAEGVESYSAALRFSLSGPRVRGRGRALVAFARPDRLRLEVPGPGGPRLLAVARGGSLVAVFPADRAVFRGAADRSAFDALLGIALTPGEVMDVLVGKPPPSLRSYLVRWGAAFPSEVDAVLPDGTRLRLSVEAPDAGASVPLAAFLEPADDAYRAIDQEEARSLWRR